MNNQSPLHDPFDRHAARRQRREARRAALGAPTGSGTLMLGLLLILFGEYSSCRIWAQSPFP